MARFFLVYPLQRLLCLSFVAFSSIQAAEPSKSQDVDDNFQADPRRVYLTAGEIEWKQGLLKLKSGSTLAHSNEAGPTAKVSVTLHGISDPRHEASETRVGFLISRAPFEMVLSYPKAGTKPPQVLVVSEYPNDKGQLQPEVLRVFDAPEDPRGEWTLQLNQGFLEIAHNKRDLGAAWAFPYTTSGVKQVHLKQQAGHSEWSGWKIRLSAPEPMNAGINSIPDAELTKIKELNLSSGKLLKPGTLQQSYDAAAEAEKICQKYVGAKHPFTIAFQSKMTGALEQMGRSAEAVAIRKKIVATQRETFGELHPEYASALRDLASTLLMTGENQEALEPLETALGILRRTLGNEDREVLRTTMQYASSLVNTARHLEALPHFAAVRKGLEKLDGLENLSLCMPLEAEAMCHQASADYKKAGELFERSVKIHTAVQGALHHDTLAAQRQWAVSLSRQGRYAESRTLLESMIEALAKDAEKNNLPLAETRIELAVLLEGHGDLVYARALYEKALTQLERQPANDAPQWMIARRSTAMDSLAGILLLAGEHKQALQMYAKSAELMEASWGKDNALSLSARFKLGHAQQELGQLDEARAIFLDILQRQNGTGDQDSPKAAVTLSTLANLEQAQGNLKAARDYKKRALAVTIQMYGKDHENVATMQRELTNMLVGLNELDEVPRLMADSLAIMTATYGQRHLKLVEQYRFHAMLYISLQDWAAAAEHLQRSLEMELALCEAELPSLPEAQAILHVAHLEQTRAQYLNMCATVHKYGPKILLPKLKTIPEISVEKIYRLVFQTRAIATRSITRPPFNAADPDQVKLRDLRAEIAAMTNSTRKELTTDQYRARLQQLTEQKEQLQRKVAVAQAKPELATSAEISTLLKRLPEDLALIDIIRSPDQKSRVSKMIEEPTANYEAFVLRRQQAAPGYRITWIHLGDSKPIDEQIEVLRQVSGKRGLTPLKEAPAKAKTWDAATEQIGRLVWDYLLPELEGCKTAIIIPDGPLAFVPWSALPGKKRGTFVVHDMAVAIAMNGQQVFELLDQVPCSGKQMLLAGGIDYGSPAKSNEAKWSELPGTRAEIASVAELWERFGKATVLSEKEATKSRLLTELPSARYVHIASHAFFADPKKQSRVFNPGIVPNESALAMATNVGSFSVLRNPLTLTGIVLAGANVQADPKLASLTDGVLTGEEVDSCNLKNAELVVLSACETGLGAVAGGEGVFGLQRAFHLAGARTVIASLWKVDDVATQTLMIELYRNLWERKQTRIEALRNAQLTMIRCYDPRQGKLDEEVQNTPLTMPAPYYWAAFVLSGDWRQVGTSND